MILFSLIIVFVFIYQITEQFIPKILMYIYGVVYIILNLLFSMIWIFGLGDYLAPIKYANIQNEGYKITMRATGNFSDIQVKCDLRKIYIDNLVYKTVDEKLIKEVEIEDLISFEETDSSFEIGRASCRERV